MNFKTIKGPVDPLQYSWASLGSQLVKNLPMMQETWVQSLAWEDPLEEEILRNWEGQMSVGLGMVHFSMWGLQRGIRSL